MDTITLRNIQLESRRLRDELIESPCTSYGCYPLFAVTTDGGALCHKCCKTESRSIGSTCGTDGWRIDGISVNWEDTELYCDHCGELIESAYGEAE
jgi:hypothetical protein